MAEKGFLNVLNATIKILSQIKPWINLCLTPPKTGNAGFPTSCLLLKRFIATAFHWLSIIEVDGINDWLFNGEVFADVHDLLFPEVISTPD